MAKYLSNFGQITGYGSAYWDKGLDVDLRKGDPVTAPKSGRVVHAGAKGGFGNQVALLTNTGETIMLSHLDAIDVKPGDSVVRGQKLGAGGNSGRTYSTTGGDGSHLDITMKTKDGKYVNAIDVPKKIDPDYTKLINGIEKGRKAGKTDTELLDILTRQYPEFYTPISKARQRYSIDTKITNDRDLLNFMSQKYSGAAPKTPSVAGKENELQFTKEDDAKINAFVKNALDYQKKKTPQLDTKAAERQLKINQSVIKNTIKQASILGVDEALATRLLERGMYDKLGELMQSSGAAQNMGKESEMTFKNALAQLTGGEQILGDVIATNRMASSKELAAYQESQAKLSETTRNLVKKIGEKKRAGEDTFRLERQLANVTGIEDIDINALLPAAMFSKGKIIGAVTQTVTDAYMPGFFKGSAEATKLLGKATAPALTHLAESLASRKGVSTVAKESILKGANTMGKVTAKEGGVAGGVQGIAQGMQEDEDFWNTVEKGFTSALFGTAIGYGMGGLIGGFSSRAYNRQVNDALSEFYAPKFGNAKTEIAKEFNPLQKMGLTIQRINLKPTARDINNGFNINNVAKHDVGGDVYTGYSKTRGKLKEYSDVLNEMIIAKGGEAPMIDLKKNIDTLRDMYETKSFNQLGEVGEALDELKFIESELDKIDADWATKKYSFSDGIDIKRKAGLNAVWNHDPLKPNLTGAKEKVWNDFYEVMRKDLEVNAPAEFKEVNTAISELIPIEQAYLRRARQLDKNNVLSLTDVITLTGGTISPKALGLGLINRMLKSGTFGNILMKTGSIPKALRATPIKDLKGAGIMINGNKVSLDGQLIDMSRLPEKGGQSLWQQLKNLLGDESGFVDFGAMAEDAKKVIGKNPKDIYAINPKTGEKILNDGTTVPGDKKPSKSLEKFYHATVNTNADEIISGKYKKSEGVYGKGIYFSKNPETAKQFAKLQMTTKKGFRQILEQEAGVKLKEFDFDSNKTGDWLEIATNYLEERGVDTSKIKAIDFNKILEKEIKKDGYDGLYIKDKDYALIYDENKIKETKKYGDLFGKVLVPTTLFGSGEAVKKKVEEKKEPTIKEKIEAKKQAKQAEIKSKIEANKKFLGEDINKIKKTIVGAESAGGDEENFKAILKRDNPGRLKDDGVNKYGDAGKFGWVVGFTIGTYEGVKQKAENGDKRYVELLKKLNFDTKENAENSAIAYLKFKNTMFDSKGNAVGNKQENIEDAYVKVYNASGNQGHARKNWQQNYSSL